MNFIMKHTLGDDWQDLFDIVVFNARKPLFTNIEAPFYQCDSDQTDLKGRRFRILETFLIARSKIFTEGNAALLTEYFQKLLRKPDLKVAYFGS